MSLLCAWLATPNMYAATAAANAGRTFYVSPYGHDDRSGRSPRAAWRTVDQVNRAHLRGGDRVLFLGGATFADDILMPGWGLSVSGSRGRPVVFGSYGHGRAWLPQGIWIKGEQHLTFEDLILSHGGVGGSGSEITVQRDRIANIYDAGRFAINVSGRDWTIRDNSIFRIGDSGMLLVGSHFLVANNSIVETGLNPAVTWGAHGVYLKASDSTVVGNLIERFHNEGVSARYHDSTIADNRISDGQYGIAWHQYDTASGTSHWTSNRITGTTVIGIYISPHDIGGYTHEHIVVAHNVIAPARGIRTALVHDLIHPLSGVLGSTPR